MSEPTWSIPLPAGAEPPVEVYINSVKLEPGEFSVEGRWIRVRRRIVPKPQMGFGRRLMLGIGIGVYGDLRADQVDISYRVGGQTRFETGVQVIPPTDANPGSPTRA